MYDNIIQMNTDIVKSTKKNGSPVCGMLLARFEAKWNDFIKVKSIRCDDLSTNQLVI